MHVCMYMACAYSKYNYVHDIQPDPHIKICQGMQLPSCELLSYNNTLETCYFTLEWGT